LLDTLRQQLYFPRANGPFYFTGFLNFQVVKQGAEDINGILVFLSLKPLPFSIDFKIERPVLITVIVDWFEGLYALYEVQCSSYLGHVLSPCNI
jgi:hypothetical protein